MSNTLQKTIRKEKLIWGGGGKLNKGYIGVHSGSVKVVGESLFFSALLAQLLPRLAQPSRSGAVCFASFPNICPRGCFLFVPAPVTPERGASSTLLTQSPGSWGPAIPSPASPPAGSVGGDLTAPAVHGLYGTAGACASCSWLPARACTSVACEATLGKGVPSLEGVAEQIRPPGGTGIAWPGVPAVCRCQGVNRHFAISALSPKRGNKS